MVMDQGAVTHVCPLPDQGHVPGPVPVSRPRVQLSCDPGGPLSALQAPALHPDHQLAGALPRLETVPGLQGLQADILNLRDNDDDIMSLDLLLVTHLRFLLVPGDGGPGELPVAQVVAGGVGQGAYEHLSLLPAQTLLQPRGADLAGLALVLVDEVALAVVLVSVAPN